MRRQRVGLAVFLAGGAIAGARVVTDAPQPAGRVPVEGPAAQHTEPAPALSMDEMMRQAADSLAGQRLCRTPPVELTEEQKRAVEEALSTVPVPTVPADSPGAVRNEHHRLVPC